MTLTQNLVMRAPIQLQCNFSYTVAGEIYILTTLISAKAMMQGSIMHSIPCDSAAPGPV